ncbi:MAG: hypothetical protein H7061_11210 [Bdellovibrionaceae bacterium]|nr:hypothetical protein [Bdellovibrio sp.]
MKKITVLSLLLCLLSPMLSYANFSDDIKCKATDATGRNNCMLEILDAQAAEITKLNSKINEEAISVEMRKIADAVMIAHKDKNSSCENISTLSAAKFLAIGDKNAFSRDKEQFRSVCLMYVNDQIIKGLNSLVSNK